MENKTNKIYIGFITYGELTAKYLPYFLPSLKGQSFKDFKILAIDNSETQENKNSKYIKENFPEINLKWIGENLGFAKAFNLMINQAIEDGAEYFLPLNIDMIFEADMIEQLVKAIEKTENCAAAQAKILKWDFTNNKKTDQIDSLGLALNKEHRFFDSHQGEIDDKIKNNNFETFGFTGTAVLLNLKALEDVAFNNGKHKEYFDELMFMYKEDCDLSYRLRLAGWKIILVSNALAYHNRSVAAKGKSNLAIALNRKNKNKAVKKWSFLNQWILLLKLKNLPFSLNVKLATAWYQLKSLIFALLFEQFLFKELIKLWQIRAEIKKRRDQLKIRVNIKEIEKFM
ncbi:MAG: glycosyltransferase family 2 protein [Patescibacteria group bacterium]|jgi:hypothetical protein